MGKGRILGTFFMAFILLSKSGFMLIFFDLFAIIIVN